MSEGHLVADGHRLEYRWQGEPGRRAAVVLHEGLGCVSMWKDFPKRLSDALGLPVFNYSRVGYGRSDPVSLPRPLTYMHHEGSVVLPQVLEAAGIEEALLVGHSDGGSIAIVYAGEGGERASGLVLLAAHVFVEPECEQTLLDIRRSFLEDDLRERLERRHGANVDCAFWGWAEAWGDPQFRHWNLEEFLPRISTPTLVVQGRDDTYGTLAQVEAIERGVAGPVRRLVLENCGHSAYRDQPELLLTGIRDFRDRHLTTEA